MKKKTEEGAAEFYEMFADFVWKRLGKRIEHFTEIEGARIVFRENLYQLFTLYLSEEKKVLLFSNLKKMHPSFHADLHNLFSFLGFVIEDKSK